MAKDKLEKAQTGTSIPAPSIPKPMLDEGFMEERFGGYKAPTGMPEFQFDTVTATPIGSSEPEVNSVEALMNKVRSTPSGEGVGPITRTGDQYIGSERYDYFNPDAGWDNEDAAAQGQGWGAQMVNGVAKGLALTGTTFLQNTVGLVNGTFQAISDGRMASFYDNDFNRALDKFNKKLEDSLPNYYTAASRDADWYAPDYWMTGNFLWDGVIKNMGFAAGTFLSAGVYTNILKGIPLASKLFSTGKAGEAIAATEAGLAGGKGAAGIYGELKTLSDSFLKVAGGYNTLNKGQRVLVSGLSTTGEAGFEGLHNMNDFREKLISKYREEKGVVPNGEDLAEINKIADAAGNSSMFANMMLLTATNYIQLPKIMSSSYSAEKTLLNGLGKETKDIVFDEAGRASRKQVSKLGRVVNAIRKPYLFSYSEALEESSQFGIGTATEDYYDKAYNGEATSWMESIGVGVTQGMFSNEGAKNALIGGLSGSIMMNVIPSATSLITGKETEKQRLSRQTDEAVKEFNSSNLPDALKQMKFQLSNFTEETKESVNRGTVLQTEREARLKAGDIFTSKNLEADYIINYLTPRIKYGRFDLVKSEIDEYKTLASTDAGFEQLVKEGKANQTDTREAYAARLQRFEETANSAYSFYQSLNLRYGSAFNVDEDDEPILDKDGKGTLKYPPSVMNKMLYTALKTEDFDQRILTLEGKLAAAGINTSEVLKSVVDGNFEAYNKAVEQIKSLDILGEKKDTLGSYLDDLADAAAQRQTFIKTYEDIKENPSKYLSEPIRQEQTDTPDVAPETIKVQTENGVVDVEVETEYFVGNSVDYNEDGLDEIFKIGTLIVKGYNEDGTLKIVNTKTGEERNLTRGTFNKLKLGKVSTTKSNKTANYFYNHRNEIFELNRGKNFGGRVRGRIEYDNGKLYFVYKTKSSTSNIKRKQLDNSFFVPQEGYDLPRITRVGNVQSKDQKVSEEQFTSPQEVAKNRETLAKNRKARLEVLTQLGEEGKQNIAELEKTITKASEDLAKVKEDLANIRKMKKAGPDGPKIKLTFSKATKSFTRSINKLTQMRKDLNKTIKLAEAEREEVLNDISYFEQYANEISDAPEDSGEFLKELKSQVKILADNGKNLANIIKAAKKMGTTLRQVTKKAASLFKKAIKSTYIVDDTYAQSLNDLLSDVAAGTDLDVTWPALKQEIVNFQLTNDISKDVNLNEADIENTVSEVRKLESDIAELRNEYRARKIILDRFQSIMNEYNAQKAAEEKILNDQKLLDKILHTGIKAEPLKEYDGPYNPIKLKSTDILPVAAISINEGKDHQIRANTFGANLNSFENRDDIRGIYLTSAIQDQLLPGVVERMLDGDPDLIKKYKDSMIIMVMVNENGELVGEDGQPIPEGEPLLDNAIYQAMPEAGLTNTKGSMFREGTDEAVKTSVIEQYAKFTQAVLNQTALGIPQVIEASFGSPKYSIDSNGNNVYTDVTSVQDAGLIDEVSLEKKPLIFVPKSKGTVSEGTVSYDSPLGRVFLRMPNAYVPLRNRKHTRKEATVIFETILQLSKNIVKGEGVESNSSIDLLNFLKRVTYWGMPLDNNGERKEPGRNSVFFQRTDPSAGGGLKFTKLQLIIGKSPDSKFDFAPSELEMQKDLIISVLENTYNNVNAYDQILNDLDAEFQQIVGIENGEIQDVIWPNYQTYLLSNTNPDGSTRESYELPLHTNLKVKEEGEDIYFFSKTGQENYTVPSPAAQREKANQATNLPITKEGKAVVTPSTPTIPATPTQSKGSKLYTLDGETMNQYVFADGQILSFKWRQQKGVVPAKEQIVIYNQPGDNFQEIIDAIPVKSTNVPEEIKKKKSDYLKGLIFIAIEAQLAHEKAKFAFSIEISDAAVEKGEAEGGGRGLFDDVAPVSPTQQTSEVKSENISNKGSEFAKKLTNPGNNLKVTYKGREFRNAEHAYQTYKSGEFDQKAYDSNAFKPVGSKPANRNTNYQTMVDILKAKLEQHPELIEGISQRGGLAYIEQSTHNVTGDKFWESKGQNKFIEALGDAYRSTQPTQQTNEVEAITKKVSKLKFDERIAALKKEGVIASDITYNLGKRFPVIININGTPYKVPIYNV